MEDNEKYGILLNSNAKLHRQWFREACKLLGIWVLYRAPKPNKHYTSYAEIESDFEQPLLVGCMFHDHPDQRTLNKIGWVSELQENASLIDVDYDLPGLQQGALFIVPSGLDDGKGRLFRVVSMQNSIVFPSCVTCEIIPEYENIFQPETAYDFTKADFTLLNEEPDRLFGTSGEW